MIRALPLLLLLAVQAAAAPAPVARDPHSYAEPGAVVDHAEFDLEVLMEERVVRGYTRLRVNRPDPSAPLVLDTRGLKITGVRASSDGTAFAPAPFTLGKADEILGAPLRITLPAGAKFVTIDHESAPGASALQWLSPRQTAGKRYPFFFTQSQAIHARSWLPLQDSPGVRITYSARIRAPWPLAAVMSADGNAKGGVARPPEPTAELDKQKIKSGEHTREFFFKMDKPIPPYLLALAVGELGFKELGPRTGVYAEPAMLDAAAKELEDVESMMSSVEKLYGPYRWGRYDVLVLPPSFAYGGMENPTLTFVSPTIIAGDKSMVGVLAHELAHSWSGNLVTNATARDFWLNEGFTTYVESRILEAVYGPERAAMEAVLDFRELEAEMKELPPSDRVLHIDLKGRDPDEGVTDVPYTKGALFLKTLEREFGRERLDKFLRSWFDSHAFRSVTTADFRGFLKAELLDADPAAAKKVPVEEWITAPSLPSGAPRAVSAAFEAVEKRTKAWMSGAESDASLAAASARWTAHERQHLLRSLPKTLPAERMDRLEKIFGFGATGNSSVACDWLELAIRSAYEPAMPRLEQFLTSVGRGKYVKPLFKELAKTPEGRKRGLAIFEKARAGYQVPIVSAVEKILAGKS